MRKICFASLIALLLTGSFGTLHAQNGRDKACLDNTEQFIISSNYVKGENYRIQVGLPIGYSSSSSKSYPVYYFTDGDVAFGMTKEIAGLSMMGKDIKDIIVVGISYGQGILGWYTKRTRDLTPTRDSIIAKGMISGGADNFLKFIQFELFPLINKNYRTIPDSNAIGGHSFGGLLGAYILFKQPELFKKYVIGSPSLIWNKRFISKSESEYFSKHKELKCDVFIYYASRDGKDEIINPTDELIQNIKQHNYQGLRLVTRVFEGETHTSVTAPGVAAGLRVIFKP